MEPDPHNPLVFEPDMEVSYTLEVVSELTGLSQQTILLYREQGLLGSAASDETGVEPFNDETLRTLRRIEHLRATCDMNVAGLKLLLDLMDEVDRLRECLRTRR